MKKVFFFLSFICQIFTTYIHTGMDVLENVDMTDAERTSLNIANKKARPEYKAYDEPEYDELGVVSFCVFFLRVDVCIFLPDKFIFFVKFTFAHTV